MIGSSWEFSLRRATKVFELGNLGSSFGWDGRGLGRCWDESFVLRAEEWVVWMGKGKVIDVMRGLRIRKRRANSLIIIGLHFGKERNVSVGA
jgi:hypothetical protein